MRKIILLGIFGLFALSAYSEKNDNYIVSVNPVDDVEVYYGASPLFAIDLLAQETTIVDNFDNTYIVELNWELIDYDALIIGDFDAVGTFELPEGVQQSDPPTPLSVNAIVTVLEAGLINEIDFYNEVEDIEVPFGTPESEARNTFQQEITITDTHGFEFIVILDWTIDDYDAETPAVYNANGTFTVPFGVDQTNPPTDKIVYAQVTVLEPLFNLELNANPLGSASLNGEGEYFEGEEINISATPNENWEFVNWTYADNSLASNEMDFTFTMPAENVQLTANFMDASSIDDEVFENLDLFYNHNSQSIIIESSNKIDQLQVYDINGRIVLVKQINDIQANVNLSNVQSGVYLIRLSSEGAVISRKIIIK